MWTFLYVWEKKMSFIDNKDVCTQNYSYRLITQQILGLPTDWDWAITDFYLIKKSWRMRRRSCASHRGRSLMASAMYVWDIGRSNGLYLLETRNDNIGDTEFSKKPTAAVIMLDAAHLRNVTRDAVYLPSAQTN